MSTGEDVVALSTKRFFSYELFSAAKILRYPDNSGVMHKILDDYMPFHLGSIIVPKRQIVSVINKPEHLDIYYNKFLASVSEEEEEFDVSDFSDTQQLTDAIIENRDVKGESIH